MLKNVIKIVDSKNDCILIVNSPGWDCILFKIKQCFKTPMFYFGQP